MRITPIINPEMLLAVCLLSVYAGLYRTGDIQAAMGSLFAIGFMYVLMKLFSKGAV